jgi:hypothetical protein
MMSRTLTVAKHLVVVDATTQILVDAVVEEQIDFTACCRAVSEEVGRFEVRDPELIPRHEGAARVEAHLHTPLGEEIHDDGAIGTV